jgi:hypothetical protein
MDEFIPEFRAHISLSEQHNEIIMSAQMKSADSPYPEIYEGYSWNDFVPVSVSPFGSSQVFLGQRVKDILLLSRVHYKAPATKKLLEEWESRKRYLEKIFGNPDLRKLENRVFGPRAAIASSAQNLQLFWSEYDHIIIEDHGNEQILIGKLTDLNQLAKTSEMKPSIILGLNSGDDILWKSIIELG